MAEVNGDHTGVGKAAFWFACDDQATAAVEVRHSRVVVGLRRRVMGVLCLVAQVLAAPEPRLVSAGLELRVVMNPEEALARSTRT